MSKIKIQFLFCILAVVCVVITLHGLWIQQTWRIFSAHCLREKERTVSNEISNELINKMFMKYYPNLEKFRNWAVAIERQQVYHEMKDYVFPDPSAKLENLLMELGGEPMKSAIFTTWRSGSTFLGEALDTNPGTFYQYEFLLHFGINQVRDGETAKDAISHLWRLVQCQYDNMEEYLEYGKDHRWLFSHNTRLFQYCKDDIQVCLDPDFLSQMCRLFPFQSFKTVRMRLRLAEEFLLDPFLNFRVLLLVRDPRGTLQSRQHRTWCPGNPDCDDPQKLCQDLEEDFYTARVFRETFPNAFLIMRYEDLAMNPEKGLKKIYKFFHLHYHPKVQQFLKTHTTKNTTGVSSTFKDSKFAAFHWRQDYVQSFSKVENIQNVCAKAMELWGYRMAANESHLSKLDPMLPPPWSDMNIF